MFNIFGRRERDRDLVERVEALEKKLKGIELEWDDWYGKYRRLYARLAKRMRDEEQSPERPVEAESPNGRPRTLNPLAARLLEPPGVNR